MLISDFDYDLPEDRIAQHPLDQRDASRMLVLDRGKQIWTDRGFRDLPDFLRAGDLVVLNNTRVFPARLIGSRHPTGGRAELFLIREVEPGVWEALARPAKRLAAGSRVEFGAGRLIAEVIGELPEGRRRVRFESAEPITQVIEAIGLTPLPPYIKRDEASAAEDRERYQTVYARSSGADWCAKTRRLTKGCISGLPDNCRTDICCRTGSPWGCRGTGRGRRCASRR